MANDSTNPANLDPLETVLAALREGGPRTAGRLAEHMGIPYSSLTPRLRQLEADGRTERIRDPQLRVTIWQTTTGAAGDDGDDPTTSSPAEADDTSRGHVDAPLDDPTAPGDNVPPTPDVEPDLDPEPEVAGEPHEPESTASVEGPGDSVADQAATEPVPAGEAADGASGGETATDKSRRPHGTIPAAILALARANPDTTYKVSQLSKALDGASQGAVANAAHKLVANGELLLVVERPATFQAA